jgi:hypothetical protein
MAIKSVAINSGVTPAPKVAQAEEMLGKVVQPIKTRWQPGSLAGQALGLVVAPCILILSATKLLVLESAEGAVDVIIPAMDSTPTPLLEAVAVAGTSRSRALDLSASGSLTPASFAANGGYDAGLCNLMAIAPAPTMSATQILNAVDGYFQDRETPVDYAVLIDQLTGRVFVIDNDFDQTEVLSVAAGEGLVTVAAFNLTEPTVEEPTDGGPIWG